MDFTHKKELVRQLLAYVVHKDEMAAARSLFDRYQDDSLAMELLYTHYSMPQGREDGGIVDLRLAGQCRGVYLVLACTSDESHLYLLSSEGAEYQSVDQQGAPDAELVAHFGPDLPRLLQLDRTALPSYTPLIEDFATCPACQCRNGEFHELGCPVEVCPWCGGQLVHCSCRFEQMGRDVLDENDVVELEELLTKTGRLPFSPEQRPFFVAPDSNRPD